MAVDTGNKITPEEYIPEILDQSNSVDQVNEERRSILRKLAVGTAVLAGCSVLPEKWTTPLVEFGTLPAHATTSGEDEEEVAEEDEKAADEEAADEEEDEEEDDMHGYDNKLTIKNTGDKVSVDRILQDKFIFPKLGPKYGKSFLVVWSDDNELFVPDSTRMILKSAPDARKYQPGYPYSSNREIRTMEVYAKRRTHPESVTLYY